MVKVANIDSLTPKPLTYIGRIAGKCYGKSGGDARRAIRCWRNGHMSVFEHVSVTFEVDDISRACSHQLVRHRLASYTQESQRYKTVDADPESTEWYVTPPSMAGDKIYERLMSDLAIEYELAVKRGIKPEDARYLLPEATKTSIAVTMNLRELRHFHELRADKSAQWEIRRVAEAMVDALPNSAEWLDLVDLLQEDLK